MRTRLIPIAVLALVLGGGLVAYAAAPNLDNAVKTWSFNNVGANGGLVYGTATCPEGQRITGGGVDSLGIASTAKSYQVVLSNPQDSSGTTSGTNTGDIGIRWYSSIQNFTPSSQNVKGFALCSLYNDAVIQAQTGDIATNGTIGLTVMCPSGTRVVGGGIGTSTGGNPAPHAGHLGLADPHQRPGRRLQADVPDADGRHRARLARVHREQHGLGADGQGLRLVLEELRRDGAVGRRRRQQQRQRAIRRVRGRPSRHRRRPDRVEPFAGRGRRAVHDAGQRASGRRLHDIQHHGRHRRRQVVRRGGQHDPDHGPGRRALRGQHHPVRA